MVTQGMIDFFLNEFPEFKGWDYEKLYCLVKHCFLIGSYLDVKHHEHEGAQILSSKYVEKNICRSFRALNEKYKFFDFVSEYREGSARPCFPAPELSKLMEDFHQSDLRHNSKLVSATTPNRKFRKPACAVLSKDTDNRLIALPRELKTKLQIRIKLNRNVISNLIKSVEHSFGDKQVRIVKAAQYFLTIMDENDTIHAIYNEASSGRLYGVGANLQNCPSEVRRAALSGQFDHDITNCHFAILRSLSARFCVETESLDYYCTERENFLNELIHSTNQSRNALKKALLAMIYGACLNKGKDIETILEDGFNAFASDREVRGLYEDIRKLAELLISPEIQEVIFGALPSTGRVLNILGKQVRSSSLGKDLAHILQGYETKILHGAIELYGENISVLQHDGFTLPYEQDMSELEERVKEELGIDIEYSVDKLEVTND